MAIYRSKLSEDALVLMRRIVEANAWRQYLGVNILGHCIKMMGDFEGKRGVANEIGVCLDLYGELTAVYKELDGGDLDYAVRDRLLNVPMPESRFELGVCRLLTDRAQRIVMASFHNSKCKPFAALAKRHSKRPALVGDGERERMREFCSEPANHPRASEILARWLGISLMALGRPGTAGDQRAMDLGLRSESSEVQMRQYLDEVRQLVKSWGIEMPGSERIAADVPEKLLAPA
ncbi:MAG: hypothetical protein P1V81_05955 [Planctomycetota bacterium]|nr:hypothetical protein [Planctomycetota bacterium]